jgi:hypothetical protein
MKCASRRGYVLPLVFLLSMIVAFALALIVERNGAKTRNVQRQVEGYRMHHAAKGLQEAISAWITTQNARTIADSLGENGHALDITLPDRSIVSVFLRDGQGTMLEPSAAESTVYTDALALRERLELLCKVEEIAVADHVRPLGPFAMSVNSAPEVVLTAVAEHLVGTSAAPEFLTRVLDKRQQTGSRMTRADLVAVGTEMGLANDVRNRVLSMLTVQPELWYVTIELRGGGGVSSQRLTARYGGLVPIRSNTGAGASGAWEQPGVFLTWEDLGVEYNEPGGQLP